MFNRTVRLLAAVALVLCAAPAQAEYPERPVTIVSPFGDGSTTRIARIVAKRLESALGVAVIVETRPGAGGAIGTEAVARAKPDGYMLLHTGSSNLALPFAKKKLYDARTDFAPVGFTVEHAPPVLLVPAQFQGGFAELITRAREQPGTLRWISNTRNLPYLSALQVISITNMEVRHVPASSEGQAIQLLIGKQRDVEFAVVLPGSARGVMESGSVRALLQLSAIRSPLMPDIPSVKSAGLGGFIDVPANNALLAPNGTPPEAIERLAVELRRIKKDPAFAKEARGELATPINGDPIDVSAWVGRTVTGLNGLVDRFGIERN